MTTRAVSSSDTSMPHKLGQRSEGLKTLCFDELRGSDDKVLSRSIHFTNGNKYKGPRDHFAYYFYAGIILFLYFITIIVSLTLAIYTI